MRSAGRRARGPTLSDMGEAGGWAFQTPAEVSVQGVQGSNVAEGTAEHFTE